MTPRSLSGSGHPALNQLTENGYELVFPKPGKTPTEEDLLSVIPGCVGWLAGVEPISARVIEKSKNLKVISRNGVGIDNIDLEAANSHNINIERAAAANARGVAELAITLMLASFRHVPWCHDRLREGQWKRRIGIEARGRTLGVVGCGAIGRTVAQLASALDMNVLGYDPYPMKNFHMDGFRYASMEEVFSGSDVISFHCPPGEKPIVNAKTIAEMHKGVFIINTARADLLDDEDVLQGLESGHIAGLATDVFHQEPPEASQLLYHDNVILMPHSGGFTSESVERATRQAVENLLKVLQG